MLQIPDAAAFHKKFARLSMVQHEAGEKVLAAGSNTGQLLILKSGAVEVVKDGEQIAKVSEPGAVFGELAILLDQPHTADVRALERSRFHISDASTLLEDPTIAIYIAAILAQRLDNANQAIIDAKRQLGSGASTDVIGETVQKVEQVLNSSVGANLVYAGYPYDPFAT